MRTALIYNVLPRRDEGSGMSCADRSLIAYWPPFRIRNRAIRFMSVDHFPIPLHTELIEYTQQDSNFDGLLAPIQDSEPGYQIHER